MCLIRAIAAVGMLEDERACVLRKLDGLLVVPEVNVANALASDHVVVRCGQ